MSPHHFIVCAGFEEIPSMVSQPKLPGLVSLAVRPQLSTVLETLRSREWERWMDVWMDNLETMPAEMDVTAPVEFYHHG